ncbi:MAG: hypothetical protein KBD36_04985 [Alphaproteobacteria bacterium]|nr:hypothetical protein [Alphaproteobacteria bacterium]MBP9777180.1 hypothetical protein [Alphaproteobacteria bacterium]
MLQAFAQKSITLIADPAVISIPITENNEPLIDPKNQTVIIGWSIKTAKGSYIT